MDKSTKTQPKKSSSGNTNKEAKKSQANKKKKKPRRVSNAREVGKSSTSPEQDANLSDVNNADVDSECSLSDGVGLNTIRKTSSKPSDARPSNRTAIVGPCLGTSPVQPPKKDLTAVTKTESQKIGLSSAQHANTYSRAAAQSNSTQHNSSLTGSAAQGNLSSLRWENQLSDPEAEDDRIRAYKLNRRKRYIAASNQSYSEWLSSGTSVGNSRKSELGDSPGAKPQVKKSGSHHNTTALETHTQEMSSSVKPALYQMHSQEVLLMKC